MIEAARQLDALYQAKDIKRMGRPWSLSEFFSQCSADWGELAEQVGRFEGFRPGSYDRHAAEHELGDLLWALMVIADRMGIDLGKAFLETASGLSSELQKPSPGFRLLPPMGNRDPGGDR